MVKKVVLGGVSILLLGHSALAAQVVLQGSVGPSFPVGAHRSLSNGWLSQAGLLMPIGDIGASGGLIGVYGHNGPGTPHSWRGGLGVLQYTLGDPNSSAPFLTAGLGFALRSDPTDPDDELGRATSLGLGIGTAPGRLRGILQANWTRLLTVNLLGISGGFHLTL